MYRKQIELMGDKLVFVTAENEQMLRVAADMRDYFQEADKQKREADETKN
jgi:hypothetical protein